MAKKKKSTLKRLFTGNTTSRVKNRKQQKRRIMILTVLLIAAVGAYLTLFSRAALNVQAGMAVDFGWGAGAQEAQQETDLMRQAGVKWIRTQCNWDNVQKSAGGNYNWYCDRNIDIARNGGLNVLLNLMQTPSWAQTGYANRDWPPTSDHYDDWANYVSAAVTHFKAKGIHHFEIWNEPNLGKFWKNKPNAVDFTKLMQVSYRAAKAADPDAKIVVGGLAHNDFYFVTQMYNAGLKGNYDIMATHPYSGRNAPDVGSTTDKNSFVSYAEVKRRIDAYEGNTTKKIWFTEIGWSTCTTHSWCVSEATQADYMKRMFNYVEKDSSYVPVIMWYNLRNNRWANNADNWEDRLGIMTTDFRLKPAYSALKSVLSGTASVSSGTQSVPLYRYYNPVSGDHFYTVDKNDVAMSSYGYRYETVTANVYKSKVAGTTPLCRYYNYTNKDHLYTVRCDNTALASKGYTFERNEAYVFAKQSSSTGGLHRYWNSSAQDHFYSLSATTPSGYVSEGVEGYVCDSASKCQAALSDASN